MVIMMMFIKVIVIIKVVVVVEVDGEVMRYLC